MSKEMCREKTESTDKKEIKEMTVKEFFNKRKLNNAERKILSEYFNSKVSQIASLIKEDE